ncbi:MmgE/PrpD family protein [Chromobacterium alkanivorans]|uniref:MmgE/PrpD family protein n=1 Tax=Chromobacterium alkanivorans TaxID=1071719 RepID=UPI00196849E7|nr:MmgE/PrpD family protein [Chromobacterium alkanivorans]MBN3004125.1 MmgE/PrpD family protein [Chromobacterium alkanivorans]
MTAITSTPASGSAGLAAFAAELRPEQVPEPVWRRAEELLLDWFGAALAGKGARPVKSIAALAEAMGPAGGAAELLISRRRSSPLFAAMVNAAASHVAEQDDVHNGAVFHPGTVVFPAALAAAQALRRSGAELLLAAIAGYEAGIRAGESLGRSHYRVFHTTGTVGGIAAAVAVGRLLRLNPEQMNHAIGSAGTQAAGLWEFLRTAADSKPLHAAHAAASGLSAAYLARDGFRGATQILEGPQGMAAGMSSDADAGRLCDRLGERWALLETSFKYHASCRHTHPAADALLQLMREHGLGADDIVRVNARVHVAALEVLGVVGRPQSVHQAKFSMGTVLGLIACHGAAGITEFERALDDDAVGDFAAKVTMEADAEVEAAYPLRWIGKVEVNTRDGRRLTCKVEQPKGDPGNTLSRAELEAKALRLAAFGGAAGPEEARLALANLWKIRGAAVVGSLLPGART